MVNETPQPLEMGTQNTAKEQSLQDLPSRINKDLNITPFLFLIAVLSSSTSHPARNAHNPPTPFMKTSWLFQPCVLPFFWNPVVLYIMHNYNYSILHHSLIQQFLNFCYVPCSVLGSRNTEVCDCITASLHLSKKLRRVDSFRIKLSLVSASQRQVQEPKARIWIQIGW